MSNTANQETFKSTATVCDHTDCHIQPVCSYDKKKDQTNF
jgi:hypothetical protein